MSRMILFKRFIFWLVLFFQAHAYAQTSQQIQVAVKEIVEQEKIPGMVAAMVSSDGVIAIGAAGIRREGSPEKFTENDVIHLGSCTKAMTAVLIATLVKEKILTWDTTIIEVFPELKNRIHKDYYSITIWGLLTHRSGVPANAKNWWDHTDMKLRKRRLALIEDTLKEALKNPRGNYLYSNLGYLIASCMAEKLTDSTWESLMQKRIFTPLKMSSAGFGSPSQDQPWGHNRIGQKWIPQQFDNAEALGPAGRVHCTVADWAKFIALQLPNAKGNGLALDPKLLNKLITPVGEYAGGWIITKRPWGKGAVLTHSGSNTMWYAIVWVAPQLDRAFMTVTNSSDNNSHAICDKMIRTLIQIEQTIQR